MTDCLHENIGVAQDGSGVVLCWDCGMEFAPKAETDEATSALAGGVRSFLSSLAFMAPEAISFQARVKLAEPLAEWEASQSSSDESDDERSERP